jgi:nucleotide-binding universal stress UspA family protein
MMSYATLMVQLELGLSNAAPLAVTRDLAKRLNASVTGLAAAQPMQVAIGDGFYTNEILRQDIEWIEEQAKAAEQQFRLEMDGFAKSVAWDMSITNYSLSERIAAASGPGDLLVAGIAQDSGEQPSSSRRVEIDQLIMELGRPIIAVPPGVRHFDFRCAFVAWKNSREARRALTDSLPLLRLMNKVVIAEVADKADCQGARVRLDRMVEWLAGHGVEALSRLAVATGDDGNQLLALAEEEGADLIVAGAYGHTRLREWVMGGVTRTLIRRSGRCLLLSR